VIKKAAPILYGCGDVIDDHEGIGGHESFRGEHTSRRFGIRVAVRPDDLYEVMSLHSDTHPRRTSAA